MHTCGQEVRKQNKGAEGGFVLGKIDHDFKSAKDGDEQTLH